MRLGTLGVVAVVMLAVLALYLGFFALPQAHVAELVPEDAAFCVCYQSIEDLRELYEKGPYTRDDSDPARIRIGERVNVPEFDGMSHTEEVALYAVPDDDGLAGVALVPFVDRAAFVRAFDSSRENLKLRAPERVAKNYLSLSAAPVRARPGPMNRRVAEACAYPAALVGRPRDAAMLRGMLRAFLGPEPLHFPQGAPPRLWEEAARLPDEVADVVVRQCADLLLGFASWKDSGDVARADVRAAPREGSFLARAGEAAGAVDLGAVVGSLPVRSLVLLGAVLDEAGWKELGLPLALGDGAFAFAVVERSRDLTLLVAARPRDAERLARLDPRALLDEPSSEVAFASVDDEGTPVRTARLGSAPEWLRDLLRSDLAKPPPVYLSCAAEGGIWYAAVGRWAEAAVRDALACRRGAAELSVRGSAFVAAHPGFFAPRRAAMGMVTAEGLKQGFRHPMPVVEIGAVGQPKAVTFVLDVDGEAKSEVRLHSR